MFLVLLSETLSFFDFSRFFVTFNPLSILLGGKKNPMSKPPKIDRKELNQPDEFVKQGRHVLEWVVGHQKKLLDMLEDEFKNKKKTGDVIEDRKIEKYNLMVKFLNVSLSTNSEIRTSSTSTSNFPIAVN